jgi:hypothetical protein
MRRATIVLAACVWAITGCRGSEAQEPAAVSGESPPAAIQAAPAEPMSSEVDVPWAIALATDSPRPGVKRPHRVIVVDREPLVTEPSAETLELEEEGQVQVLVENAPSEGKPSADEKPHTPKSCSGVVLRRS